MSVVPGATVGKLIGKKLEKQDFKNDSHRSPAFRMKLKLEMSVFVAIAFIFAVSLSVGMAAEKKP